MNKKSIDFAKRWQEKWFGFWAEEEIILGKSFDIEEHVDVEWIPEDRDLAIQYLKSCPIVIAAQQESGKCGLCGELIQPSCYRSDGHWLWTDELAHFVEKHHFILPDNMMFHMRGMSYSIPKNTDFDIGKLPWPSISK